MHIRIDGLSFRYPRRRDFALQGITCVIGPGITGLVGPNGAGKTTLFRLLLGTLRANQGMISYDEMAPDAFRARGGIGFIPDKPVFPPIRVAGFLNGLAALQHLTLSLPPDLAHLADRPLSTLSLGEARRIELMAATLGRPAVLLLDEPTNGLDPNAVMQLRNELRALNDGSRVILVASHHLDELQRVADVVLMLNRGMLAGTFAGGDSLEQAFHSLAAGQGD